MSKSSLLSVLLAFTLLAAVLLLSRLIKDEAEEGVRETRIHCHFESHSCSVHMDDGSFELNISPLPIQALNQVQISLSNLSINGDDMMLWFEGRHMDMGQHLLLPSEQNANDRLTWQGAIPICSVDPEMAWDLVISLESDGSPQRIKVAIPTSEDKNKKQDINK